MEHKSAQFDPTCLQVKYNSPNWEEDMRKMLDKYGVCHLTSVFELDRVKELRRGIATKYFNLVTKRPPGKCKGYVDSSGYACVGSDDIDPEWRLPTAREGLFQASVGNFWEMHEIREETLPVFHAIYPTHSPKTFVTSVDGMSYILPKDSRKPDKSWLHVDQGWPIKEKDPIVQGSVHLTACSTRFVVVPGSHKYLKEILELADIPREKWKEDWHPLKHAEDDIFTFMQEKGYPGRVELMAKAGDMFLWKVLHCTRTPVNVQYSTPLHVLRDQRMAVFVCSRPIEDKKELKRLQKRHDKCIRENRMTTHSLKRMFGKYTGNWRANLNREYHPRVRAILDNPELVYERIGQKRCVLDKYLYIKN